MHVSDGVVFMHSNTEAAPRSHEISSSNQMGHLIIFFPAPRQHFIHHPTPTMLFPERPKQRGGKRCGAVLKILPAACAFWAVFLTAFLGPDGVEEIILSDGKRGRDSVTGGSRRRCHVMFVSEPQMGYSPTMFERPARVYD
jgi:hypothetical protein